MTIRNYFLGKNWRVHPNWVYCRFHYHQGHEFETSEEEISHFLKKINDPDWQWSKQFEEIKEPNNCGKKTLDNDDYYCNKELMQLFIFDAKITNESFSGQFVPRNSKERRLANGYKVFTRFVATQSGLTRWQNLEPFARKDDATFGNVYRRAVNEPWYKGALFQNIIDPDSISLMVSQDEGSDATVTSSLGIFPKDDGRSTLAAVVGFQMAAKTLFKKFIQITANSSDPDFHCALDWIDCYLIDQNGYVVVSETSGDIGQFFGTIEGAVLQSLLMQKIFTAVDMYDYQATCTIMVGFLYSFLSKFQQTTTAYLMSKL